MYVPHVQPTGAPPTPSLIIGMAAFFFCAEALRRLNAFIFDVDTTRVSINVGIVIGHLVDPRLGYEVARRALRHARYVLAI